MTPEDLKRATASYREARDYAGLLEHPGWTRLAEELRDEVEAIKERAVRIGGADTLLELAMARGMLRAVEGAEAKASNLERYAKRLTEQGLSLDEVL